MTHKSWHFLWVITKNCDLNNCWKNDKKWKRSSSRVWIAWWLYVASCLMNHLQVQEWANERRPLRRRTSDVAVRWNHPCKNIVHSNKFDHHLSLSMLQLKQNHNIYYFCVFLYAADKRLFTTIFHEISSFCPSLKPRPSQTDPFLDSTGFVLKNHAWWWIGCYRILDY